MRKWPKNVAWGAAPLAFLILTVQLTAYAGDAAERIEMHTANVNGVQLQYLMAGKRSDIPVVLLHGYAETSRMWMPLIPQLADRRVVIAPDLRGAGGSSKPDSGYDKKTMAQDIHALVHDLGFQKIKIVGHDIGLMVAYAYAAQYPDEVQSIVLMDAFLPGVGDWQKVWLLRDKWHFNFYGETPLKLVAGRERIYFDHFWNDFAADPARSIPAEQRARYTAAYARPGRMRAAWTYFATIPDTARRFADLGRTKLDIPVLVVTGAKAGGTIPGTQLPLVA